MSKLAIHSDLNGLFIAQSLRKSVYAIRPYYEALFQLCCPIQNREAEALGDLVFGWLSRFQFFSFLLQSSF